MNNFYSVFNERETSSGWLNKSGDEPPGFHQNEWLSFEDEARMNYWSMAFMGMGVTLIAAVVIKFDWFGAIAGVISLFMGYALSIGADLKDKE